MVQHDIHAQNKQFALEHEQKKQDAFKALQEQPQKPQKWEE